MSLRSLFVMLCVTFAASVSLGDALASRTEAAAAASAAVSGAPASAIIAPGTVTVVDEADVADGGATTISAPAAVSSADDLIVPPIASAAASTGTAPESAAPDLAAAALNATQATRNAIEQRNLPAWLAAFASILWVLIAVARRFGRLISRRAVAITTLVAAVVGAVASQLMLGFSVVDSIVVAFGGPGAIALNEVIRSFGLADKRPSRAKPPAVTPVVPPFDPPSA